MQPPYGLRCPGSSQPPSARWLGGTRRSATGLGPWGPRHPQDGDSRPGWGLQDSREPWSGHAGPAWGPQAKPEAGSQVAAQAGRKPWKEGRQGDRVAKGPGRYCPTAGPAAPLKSPIGLWRPPGLREPPTSHSHAHSLQRAASACAVALGLRHRALSPPTPHPGCG